MGRINSVKKLTDNKFVNLYGVDATSVHDTPVSYFVASRAKSVEDMKLSTGENHPDGVIIYSIYAQIELFCRYFPTSPGIDIHDVAL